MTGDSAIAEVLLPLALEGPYSYRVPAGLALEPGTYVVVPLGPRQMIGVVWALKDKAGTEKKLRDVAGRFDMPPLPETHRKFIEWLSAYYLEPMGNVLRMVLRAPGAFEGPREQIAYRATESVPKRMTPQRARVLEIAREGFAMRASELAEAAGVGTSVIKALARDGALETVALPALRPFPEPDLNAGGFTLSKDQQAAAAALRAVVAQRQHKVMLLDGVTGSGKTEVYFEAMAAALASGGQVLLLLPEIALTEPFLIRVENRFGCEPAQWHSDVRPRERERVWRGVADGTARIVVGARSALFLPWKKLKLIVVDEEHESAYKQDDGVPYHARDMAVLYGSHRQIPGGALLRDALARNAGERGPRALRRGGPQGPARAAGAARDRADRHEARGARARHVDFAAAVRGGDEDLGRGRPGAAVPQPPGLCAADTVPRLRAPAGMPQLRGLAGGASLPAAVDVPSLRPSRTHAAGLPELPGGGQDGAGGARCGAAGGGSGGALSGGAHRHIVERSVAGNAAARCDPKDVEEGQYNLVIGTQLVAKGHHFPHLTLVGVVDADLALESSDPRGGERTWALMAQVAGRAGRGAKPGRALVQTYLPEHPLMQALKKGDRDSYLNQEKAIRENAGLPPYGRLAAIIISGTEATEVERFARNLGLIAPLADGITVLGPAQAPIAMVRGRHRWRFLVKATREVNVQGFLRLWLKDVKPKGSLALQVDVDPYNFL
jgi:primosomal protein N' (replication factor Y) (superfamily II helicase)